MNGYFTSAGTYAVFVCVMIAASLLNLFVIAAHWKIFNKLGEAGWKSIIPFYNLYVLYKATWKTMYFWIFILFYVLLVIVTSFGGRNTGEIVIAAVLGIILTFITAVSMHKLSTAFGQGIIFSIGLILFNPIFILILGFGNAIYVGNSSDW